MSITDIEKNVTKRIYFRYQVWGMNIFWIENWEAAKLKVKLKITLEWTVSKTVNGQKGVKTL